MVERKKQYQIVEQPLGSTKHLRIIGIGAGASGINVLRSLRKRLRDYEIIVYEKNPIVGGTWYENRYPGCKCDIPSHNYQFSWAPNPQWQSFFSTAEEINRYLEHCCGSENLLDSIKTNHIVTKAVWNEDQGVWMVKVQDLTTKHEFDDYCHFLLDATGILKYVKSRMQSCAIATTPN
jgi:cation diffusion facilitator CzcD-associated flavoprotein CzcO